MRERSGRFLIEGAREVERAAQAGVVLERMITSQELLAAEAAALLKRLPAPDCEWIELSTEAFQRLSQREHPDGLLAVAVLSAPTLGEVDLSEASLVLVLDGLEKPGNLGSLLRVADGAGVDAVLLTGAGTDITNPNVIRSSMGSVFSVPTVGAGTAEALERLSRAGMQIVVAAPHAAETYWDADYREATALVVGAESTGVAKPWLAAAHRLVAIPMKGLADSLNVATAGALLVYEAMRQRR